jgi:hypothetical protein
VGGLVSGLIGTNFSSIPLAAAVGGVGALLALFSGIGMLLVTWRHATSARRIIGLILGGAFAPAIFLGLLQLTWILEGADRFTSKNLLLLPYVLGDMFLIGLGIGLADYLYRRDKHA